MDASYPELVEALDEQAPDGVVLDGEIVAFEGRQTSFSRLQIRFGLTDPRRARATGVPVYLYLFDILAAGGHDLTRLPLRARKRVLRAPSSSPNRCGSPPTATPTVSSTCARPAHRDGRV